MTVTGVDVTNPAPRVNFELMNHYIGKRVTLVGKVENGAVENGVLKVKTSDEGMVDVIVTSAVPQEIFVEVDGIVESTNTIRGDSIVGFGNSFCKYFFAIAIAYILYLQAFDLSLTHSLS